MSLLAGLTQALATSDEGERARRLSAALAVVVRHRALAMLVGGCSRSPVAAAGEHGVAERITVGDFAGVEDAIAASQAWQGDAEVAGEVRPAVAVAAPGGTTSILLLVRSEATPISRDQLTTLTEAWSLFAVATRHSLDAATANDLNASRAAAAERARVASELADDHRVALTSILGALRARHLDDHAARQTAVDLAASALVALRTSTARQRDLGDELLTDAFRRLREDLEPITRYSTADLEFVAPSGETKISATVAHAARAISRGAVLALLEQPDVRRLRVAWQLADGLKIGVRDDGSGTRETSVTDEALVERAHALGGSAELESVPGWGTQLIARLPLDDAEVDTTASDPLAALRPRELEVLAELAIGRRNREIAEKFSISENTVKYHVANVFSKLGVTSRNQAALLARDAGIGVESTLRAG